MLTGVVTSFGLVRQHGPDPGAGARGRPCPHALRDADLTGCSTRGNALLAWMEMASASALDTRLLTSGRGYGCGEAVTSPFRTFGGRGAMIRR